LRGPFSEQNPTLALTPAPPSAIAIAIAPTEPHRMGGIGMAAPLVPEP
jgi:hypothetical protein